jgi:type III secretory pathway component EscV
MSLLLSETGSIFGFVVFIFVAISVVINVFDYKKKKAAKEKRNSAENSFQKTGETPFKPDTQPRQKTFDEIMREIKAEKARKEQGSFVVTEGSGQIPRERTVATTNKNTNKPPIKEDSHGHPSAHGARVEYVETTGSLNATPTEGCLEHYNNRFISEDESDLEVEQTEPTFLQQCIVIGDVLNTPVSKKGGQNSLWRK